MLRRRITMALLAAVTIAGPLAPAPLQAATWLPNLGLPGSPCVPIDAGPLSMARALEGMAALNILLQVKNNWPWQNGWKLAGTPEE